MSIRILLILTGIVVLGNRMAEGGEIKTVQIATLEWPPYIGRDMPKNGYIANITRAAFQAAGYRLRDINIEFMPWQRAVDLTREGEYDGVLCMYPSEERTRLFRLSDPVPGGPVVLFKLESRDDVDFDGTMESLRGYKIGVIAGYVNSRAFDEADYLDKAEVPTNEQNLRQLLAGRVDLIAMDHLVANYILALRIPGKLKQIKPLKPPLALNNLHVGFSRNVAESERKWRDYNEGLARIRQSGKLKSILEEHGFSDVLKVVRRSSPRLPPRALSCRPCGCACLRELLLAYRTGMRWPHLTRIEHSANRSLTLGGYTWCVPVRLRHGALGREESACGCVWYVCCCWGGSPAYPAARKSNAPT